MPIYKHLGVLQVVRGIKAFLRLEVGLTRGRVPNPEQDVRQLQQRLQQMRKQRSTVHAGRGTKTRIAGDARDHYIGRVVKGKSFADVEGLYDLLDEKVSVAHSFGATTLTTIDAAPRDAKLWQSFSDRMQYFGVLEFDTISEDISDSISASDHPRYDVVHCSGVLHRTPDPVLFMSALHTITREHLILGSIVTATGANGTEENLETPSAASLSVPASRELQDEFQENYQRPFIDNKLVRPTREETSWQGDEHASWRRFPTVDSLKAMCADAGFNYEDGAYYDNAYIMLLSRQQRP